MSVGSNPVSDLHRLASKTDMLDRLYDCLTALQQQYELNREDRLYWQQTAQAVATQLAMTGAKAVLSRWLRYKTVPCPVVSASNFPRNIASVLFVYIKRVAQLIAYLVIRPALQCNRAAV